MLILKLIKNPVVLLIMAALTYQHFNGISLTPYLAMWIVEILSTYLDDSAAPRAESFDLK
jgi:hypothetical protein